MKGLKAIIIIFIVVFLFGLIFFIMEQSNMFHISCVNCSFLGYSEDSEKIQEMASSLVGKNYYDGQIRTIKKEIENLESIKSVKFQYSFYQELYIEVDYKDIGINVGVIDDKDIIKGYYEIKDGLFIPLMDDKSIAFNSQKKVFINESDFSSLNNKGINDEFYYILYSVKRLLSENTLITKVKYANNRSKDFSWMSYEIPNLNIEVQVREPVSIGTLLDCSRILMQMGKIDEKKTFDLYSSCLVERF
ncbi:MAG: hypothetical protein WC162_01240 [Sphaerochaetaceae bacterium]